MKRASLGRLPRFCPLKPPCIPPRGITWPREAPGAKLPRLEQRKDVGPLKGAVPPTKPPTHTPEYHPLWPKNQQHETRAEGMEVWPYPDMPPRFIMCPGPECPDMLRSPPAQQDTIMGCPWERRHPTPLRRELGSPCHRLWSLSTMPPSAAPCHERSSSILRLWSPHSRRPLKGDTCELAGQDPEHPCLCIPITRPQPWGTRTWEEVGPGPRSSACQSSNCPSRPGSPGRGAQGHCGAQGSAGG